MRFFKVIVGFFVFTASILSVSAQTVKNVSTATATATATSTKPVATQQAVVLATVNIYNATSTQKGNEVTVSFDITNRTGVQPGVKYSIVLIKETSTGQIVVDEHVYDEVLSLGENSSVHKVITYQPPLYLEGGYKLFISSKNKNGFPFGTAFAGTITLTKSSTQSLNIHLNSCFLTIEGEQGNKKYTPMQGVDIAPTEVLLSNCIVENTSDSPVTAVPSFVTHNRSSFGDVVTATGGDTASMSIAPHEKKEIVTKLPKASTPQSYNVSLRYGQESNEIAYHYVIWGGSGTIQNIQLDKNVYTKGDVAKLSFMWSPSADGFFGSRKGTSTQLVSPSYTVVITDEDGKQCSQSKTEELSQKQVLTKTEIDISSDCVNPKVDVTLTDAKLGVLAHSLFETTGADVNTLPKKETNNTLLIIVIVISIVIVITLATIFFFRKKVISPQVPASPLLVILFLGVLFSGVEGVKADTFALNNGGSFTVSLNKASYAPGEIMNISGYVVDTACSNWPAYPTLFSSFDTANASLSYPALWAPAIASINTSTYVEYLNVSVVSPASAGSHKINFYGELLINVGTGVNLISDGTVSIPFTVTAPPIPTVTLSPFSPASIKVGQTSTISFSSTNATACSGVGISVGNLGGTSLTNAVTPVMSTPGTFTQSVTCTGPGGSATSVTQSLVVTPLPPTVNIWFSLLQKFQSSLSAVFASMKNVTGVESVFAESEGR
jgi:hypothetical protein